MKKLLEETCSEDKAIYIINDLFYEDHSGKELINIDFDQMLSKRLLYYKNYCELNERSLGFDIVLMLEQLDGYKHGIKEITMLLYNNVFKSSLPMGKNFYKAF